MVYDKKFESESASHSVMSDSSQHQARMLEWVDFPSSGDLPNPGIKPRSPTLQVDFLPAEPQGNKKFTIIQIGFFPINNLWFFSRCLTKFFYLTISFH